MYRFLIYWMQTGLGAIGIRSGDPHPFHNGNSDEERRAFDRSVEKEVHWQNRQAGLSG